MRLPRLLRWLRHKLFGGTYRPERHYMRGPGPAARAKRLRVLRRRGGPPAP